MSRKVALLANENLIRNARSDFNLSSTPDYTAINQEAGLISLNNFKSFKANRWIGGLVVPNKSDFIQSARVEEPSVPGSRTNNDVIYGSVHVVTCIPMRKIGPKNRMDFVDKVTSQDMQQQQQQQHFNVVLEENRMH
ncbi:hypothetical protein LOAG_01927 [Loa loa]|uniref:Uncharacterized protein n=1 Tax=Loa loa TaxID=7209 RepID=A0A1S0U8L1_LOALO|nr:hypothetical protein LOAG_01927 [Loa loa]EFO26552.1 hypothetical protein LOAG_01927 [Loa loa]